MLHWKWKGDWLYGYRMVISVSVVYSPDCTADWEIAHCCCSITLVCKKIKTGSTVSAECISFHITLKLKNYKLDQQIRGLPLYFLYVCKLTERDVRNVHKPLTALSYEEKMNLGVEIIVWQEVYFYYETSLFKKA